MRGLTRATLLGCGAAALAASVSAAPPQPAQTLIPQVGLLQLDERAAERPEELRWAGFYTSRWAGWITADDLPADLRGRALKTESYVAVTVDGSGKAAGCRILKASSEPRLDRLACDLLSRRGAFEPSYATPTRTVLATRVMGVRWEVIDSAALAERDRERAQARLAPAPPAPPSPSLDRYPQYRSWPRLEWSHNILIEALPPIQAAYPPAPGRPAEGTVGLDLIVKAGTGVAACEVGASSGNKVLDEAACTVARSLGLAYAQPCYHCWDARVPLQVVWRKRGSHIRLPLPSPYASRAAAFARDPADLRTAATYISRRMLLAPALSQSDFDRIADRSHSNSRMQVELAVDEKGRTTACRPVLTTGNAAIDQRICELLVKRARFTQRTDVFGDPVADTMPMTVDLTGRL
jgi:TonB family protein